MLPRGTTIEYILRLLSSRQKQTVDDSSLTPAAVLLLLYPKEGEHCVLLNKRTDHVEHHKGEISFPGGAQDPEDASLLETALRETHEEMGIAPTDVTVLGELDDEVIPHTFFSIATFVGTIPYPYQFSPSAREVAEVLEVPLSVLRDPATWREEARVQESRLVPSRSYTYQDHLIFGATARILRQFLEMTDGV